MFPASSALQHDNRRCKGKADRVFAFPLQTLLSARVLSAPASPRVFTAPLPKPGTLEQ